MQCVGLLLKIMLKILHSKCMTGLVIHCRDSCEAVSCEDLTLAKKGVLSEHAICRPQRLRKQRRNERRQSPSIKALERNLVPARTQSGGIKHDLCWSLSDYIIRRYSGLRQYGPFFLLFGQTPEWIAVSYICNDRILDRISLEQSLYQWWCKGGSSAWNQNYPRDSISVKACIASLGH